MINKIFSRTSGPTPPAETSSNTAAPQPQMPSARKTSQLPGGLRDLADKVTARRHKKGAQKLTDTQLMVKLSSNGLNGRDTRAVHRDFVLNLHAADQAGVAHVLQVLPAVFAHVEARG